MIQVLSLILSFVIAAADRLLAWEERRQDKLADQQLATYTELEESLRQAEQRYHDAIQVYNDLAAERQAKLRDRRRQGKIKATKLYTIASIRKPE